MTFSLCRSDLRKSFAAFASSMKPCQVLVFLIAGSHVMLCLDVTIVEMRLVTDEFRLADGHYTLTMPVVEYVSKILREQFPLVFSNLTWIPVTTKRPTSMNMQICDVLLREECIPRFSEFYYTHPHLFDKNTREHMTVVLSMDSCPPAIEQMQAITAALDVLYLCIASNDDGDTGLHAHPNFFSMSLPGAQTYFEALKGLLRQYKWFTIGVICDPDMDTTVNLCDVFRTKFLAPTDNDIEVAFLQFTSRGDTIQTILQRMQTGTRVIVSFLAPEGFRDQMIAAHYLNMTHGDYVFIATEVPPIRGMSVPMFWRGNNSDDPIALEAFDFAIILADMSVQWDLIENVTMGMKKLTTAMYDIPASVVPERDAVAALIYNLLMVFAQGLNNTLDLHLDSFTPKKFLNQLFSQPLNLPSGDVTWSDHRTVERQMSFLRLNPVSKTFQIGASYDVERKHLSVGNAELWVWNGTAYFPRNKPRCGFDGTYCWFLDTTPAAILGSILTATVLTIAILGYIIRRRLGAKTFAKTFVSSRQAVLLTNTAEIDADGTQTGLLSTSKPQVVDRVPVLATVLPVTCSQQFLAHHPKFRKTMGKVENFHHPYVAKFLCIIVHEVSSRCALVSEFGHRGNLEELLNRKDAPYDLAIKTVFLSEIAEGLLFIHKSTLGFHGDLSASVCFVDSRFTAKIAHFGYQHLKQALGLKTSLNRRIEANRQTDIYEFGVIGVALTQSKSGPNRHESTRITRYVQGINDVIQNCLRKECDLRPKIYRIRQVLHKTPGRPQNATTYMLKLLDQQAHTLETTVIEKTKELIEERRKVDDLLGEMFPTLVVGSLREKRHIPAETFESVTLLFSDIPALSSHLVNICSPLEIVALLNKTHSMFDNLISEFDVYKVETICDTYLISSGVPVRNGGQHADEICALALNLVKASHEFLVEIPGEQLCVRAEVRVGINSGPVVASVVGTRMPRYCLFGDTINTASRMESTGEPGKIHASLTTVAVASIKDLFIFESRGTIAVKGKGLVNTFWLMKRRPQIQGDNG